MYGNGFGCPTLSLCMVYHSALDSLAHIPSWLVALKSLVRRTSHTALIRTHIVTHTHARILGPSHGDTMGGSRLSSVLEALPSPPPIASVAHPPSYRRVPVRPLGSPRPARAFLLALLRSCLRTHARARVHSRAHAERSSCRSAWPRGIWCHERPSLTRCQRAMAARAVCARRWRTRSWVNRSLKRLAPAPARP